MGLFSLFGNKGMDAYVAEAAQLGAVLIDVREPGEFAGGHVPGAISIPVGSVEGAKELPASKTEPLYVYCQSGMRSSKACGKLQKLGYQNVVNIGGISSYSGQVVTGN